MAKQRPAGMDELNALKAIQDSLNERGYPPSQREISKACNWASSSGANSLIKLMAARGLIEVTPGIPRSLRITDEGAKYITGANMVAPTEAM